jgi:hypothetical protein
VPPLNSIVRRHYVKAIICRCTLLALALSTTALSAVPPQSTARSAYLRAAGDLSGSVGQIHRFFRACGERLEEVQAFLELEWKWMHTNVELEQGYRIARERPRSWMSPPQVAAVEELDRHLDEATITALRDQDDATAKATCSAFLKRVDNTELMQLFASSFLEPFRAAQKELENAEGQAR